MAISATSHSAIRPSRICSTSPEAYRAEFGNRALPRDRGPAVENERDDRRVLLAITVEIEDGSVEHIEMKEGDSAEAVATKFCRDHSLPEQFIAPLTEHIVSNIVNLRDDKGFVQHENEENSYCDAWCYKGASRPQSPRHDCGCDQQNTSGKTRSWNERTEAAARSRTHSCSTSQAKKQMKTIRRLSERLLAPTLTSLAKRPQTAEKDKSKETGRIAQRPVSDRAKAVYMRLYAEFLRHKQRIELEKARNLEIYQEKIERDRAYVSKKSWRIWRMRGRTAKQYGNYGELLYSEGLSKREQLKKLIIKKQQDDEAKELKELTLKPEISKRAKQIRRDQGQIWHRLQMPDKPRQEQLQELRNEIWEAKLMECTFKPRINRHRLSQSHGGTSRFEQLFLDAENRRRRQAEYTQWYPEGVTFQPHINRQRQSHGLDDGYYQERGTTTVFDRLLHYASKLAEKRQKSQQLASKPIDATTGQEYFRPVTGRKPLNDRNTSDLPIGEFLYQLKNTMERKRQWLAEKDAKVKKEQASCHYVNQKSQKMLESIRVRRISQIFEHLDKDKDGFVELETADLGQLADDVVKDIVRLKQVEGQKVLDIHTFVNSMKTIQEKAHKTGGFHLMIKTKQQDSPQHLQFKMDRLSRSLAGRRRRFSSSRQWYKLILADKAKWQSEIENMRKEKESLEMKECTFRPEIQKKRPSFKVTEAIDDKFYPPLESLPFSKITEKEQREMHGFIFEEEVNAGSETMKKATNSVSRDTSGAIESLSRGEDMSPMGLLESLKNLKQIVAQSVENIEEGSTQPSRAEGGQEVYYEPSIPYEVLIKAPSIDVDRANENVLFNDLPDPEGQKKGLFVGLLGA